jgi:hypothetical protein
LPIDAALARGPLCEIRPFRETVRDHRGLERAFIREVLVDRRSAHAEPVRDSSHRERVRAFFLQECAGRFDDLRPAGRVCGSSRHR